jgi:hypothetical protein
MTVLIIVKVPKLFWWGKEIGLYSAIYIKEQNYYYYYLIELQMGFSWWQWYCNKTQHTNTYVAQNNTPRSNKTHHTRYTNNKGHIVMTTTQKKSTITIPVQAVEAYRVVRRRGSFVFRICVSKKIKV